jgi:hypothetical protein
MQSADTCMEYFPRFQGPVQELPERNEQQEKEDHNEVFNAFGIENV